MRFKGRVGLVTVGVFISLAGCRGEAAEQAEQAADPAQEAVRAPEAAPSPRTAPEALPEGAQAISFLGDTLFPPEASEEARGRLEGQLEDALAELEANPGDADALIWTGRRFAYLGQYRQAIEAFTRGIELFPDDARFLRHRGHRYITVREPEMAIADFRRAAELIEGTTDEVEPDGAPNALGIPTSTLHFNVWYHYGLAHYVKGEFEEAAEKYRRCMEASEHPDSKVATAHWWYMSLRRLGRDEEARDLVQGMDLEALAPQLIESGGYFELLDLYAGSGEEGGMAGVSRESLEGATSGYGYGNWILYNGDPERAREVFQGIVDARGQWASFGYIAAEADFSRM